VTSTVYCFSLENFIQLGIGKAPLSTFTFDSFYSFGSSYYYLLDKYLMMHLMNKGFSKGIIRNALEDLYFYGFILKRPTTKRGVCELTE
jgi:hypothetical protein